MDSPSVTRRHQAKCAAAGHRTAPWWRGLLAIAIILLNVACMTISTSWKVVHQEGQEDQVVIALTVYMTDEFLAAAAQANADREADYREAEKPLSDSGFPVTMEGARVLLLGQMEDLRDRGYTLIEDGNGFAAGINYTLAEFQQTPQDRTVVLEVDRDRPEGLYYIFEVELLESVDADDLEEIDRLRQSWPLPKPSPDPIDSEKIEEGSVVGGLASLIDVIGLEGTELDLWYSQRIMLKAGLPVSEYEVELPGRILVHKVDGVSAGRVEGSTVTLVADEAFWREFGPGVHRFRVEALLSVCEDPCGKQPHWVWDGVSAHPDCTCICEKGWQMAAEGCVDCQALCRQKDPLSEYDPEKSTDNQCACRVPSDRDGDGVPDARDACPDKPATTGDGCPTREQGQGLAVPGAATAAAAAAAGTAAAVSVVVGMLNRASGTGRPAPPGPTPGRSTAQVGAQPVQPPGRVPPPPTQAAQPPPPPAQPAPLTPQQQEALDRIERTLENVDQTGTGQTRFSLDEINELIPREYNVPGMPDSLGPAVRNIRAQLDPNTGTIILRGNALLGSTLRATVKPSVQGGELRLTVQEAVAAIPPVKDPALEKIEIFPGVSHDLRGRLGPLGEMLQQQVTEAIAKRGARLQDIRVQSDGIEISLQSQEAGRKP